MKFDWWTGIKPRKDGCWMNAGKLTAMNGGWLAKWMKDWWNEMESINAASGN